MTRAPLAAEHPLTDPIAAPFRAAFRAHPAGVAIITALSAVGPVGVTASSVASVSVRPPAVSFALAAGASAWPQ